MRGGSGGFERETHLYCATVPSEDGGLAFCCKEIRFSLCEFCAEYFCMAMDELWMCEDGVENGENEWYTFIAREVAGSSSKRYSVSGWRRHSLNMTVNSDEDGVD